MGRLMLFMGLAVMAIISSQPVLAGEWIACAGENQTCIVPGTRMVRYGVGNLWSLKKATGRIQCSNDVFGDPAPGKPKACYYQATPLTDKGRRHDNDRGPRWIRCADEGQYCRFHGHKDIRYGADDRWNYKSAKDGVACNNKKFGDPAPGREKACYYRDTPPPDRKDGRHARWIHCAGEGQYCKFRGRKDIRYGTDDRWNYKSAKDGIACNNKKFGDPAPGKIKECFIRAE